MKLKSILSIICAVSLVTCTSCGDDETGSRRSRRVMPDLRGVDIEKAEKKYDFITITEQYNAYSSKYDVGEIIDQSVEPGKKIKKGEQIEVEVTISMGEKKDLYKMTDFIGMDYTEAKSKYGNHIRFVVEGYEDSFYDENTIIWQSVEPGTEYEKGDTLKVKISKGQETIEVPDLRDMNQSLAVDQLEMRGLTADIITQSDPDIAENNVIKTEPKAGDQVYKGSKVLVYVSMGSDRAQIEVEDYVGRKANEAVQLAQYYCLKVKTEPADSSEEEGTVIGQSIARGEKVEMGTEIIFYISTGVSPDGEIPFTIAFPFNANGRFVIDFDIRGEDGKISTISSSTLLVPEMDSFTQDIKGSGENVFVSVSLTNLDTGSRANLGQYYFNFAKGSVTAISEDVDGAFEQVGGFRQSN